jgi:hypothetical protein
MVNDGESCAYTAEDNEMEDGLGHSRTFGGGGGGGGGCKGSGASAASAAAGRKRRNRKKRRCGGAPIADIQEQRMGNGWELCRSGGFDCFYFWFVTVTPYTAQYASLALSVIIAYLSIILLKCR